MFKKILLPALLSLIGLSIAVMALTGLLNTKVQKDFIQGEIDATRVDVAAKFAARVDARLAEEGAAVRRGDLLLKLDGPEVRAKVQQAEQAVLAAEAQLDKAERGAREEEIRQAENALAEAQAAKNYADQTYRRLKALYDAGSSSAQVYDEALSGARRAKAAVERAQAAVDMAHAGARIEDKQMAQAQLARAKAVLAEVKATAEDLELKAPVSGEISKIMVRQGELVSPGYPLVSLVDLSDIWAVAHVREDMLNNIRMGSVLTGSIPALGDKKVEFKIHYIAPLGDFATWRATNNSGSYDLKSFEVRGKPVEKVDGLRPGMSVIFRASDNPATAPQTSSHTGALK